MLLAGNTISVIRNVFAVLYLITVLSICLMIVFENRNPVKTLAWLLVILLVPVAGVVIYVLFGRYYRKQKIYSRKGLADSKTACRTCEPSGWDAAQGAGR